MNKTPCYGCVPPQRHAECHATCPRYAEWQVWNAGRRETRAQEAVARDATWVTDTEFERRNNRYAEEKGKRKKEGIR